MQPKKQFSIWLWYENKSLLKSLLTGRLRPKSGFMINVSVVNLSKTSKPENPDRSWKTLRLLVRCCVSPRSQCVLILCVSYRGTCSTGRTMWKNKTKRAETFSEIGTPWATSLKWVSRHWKGLKKTNCKCALMQLVHVCFGFSFIFEILIILELELRSDCLWNPALPSGKAPV